MTPSRKSYRRSLLLLPIFLACSAVAFPAKADEAGFAPWKQAFRARAIAQGVPATTLDPLLQNTRYLPRVIELDQKQPEGRKTFAEYRKSTVSPERIKKGQELLRQHRPLLNRISAQYNVPPQYIVALWGIETNYGSYTGGFDTLSALATLAYEGRRAEFFEKELVQALRIMAAGHSNGERLTGSWAGAMGQNQFMPSSYNTYAVDGDGDGRKDIWKSLPDIFASIANYLHTEGWDNDLRWGRAVQVPRAIPEDAYGRDKMRPLSAWKRAGVRQQNGTELPSLANGADPLAALVAPDGVGSPSYLVYKNYNVIMHWNRSTYFATSVGLLADAIAATP